MNTAVILKSQFADNTDPKRWRKKNRNVTFNVLLSHFHKSSNL